MPGDQNGGAKSAAEVLRIFLKLGLTCFPVRSLTSATSATSSSCDGNGSTNTPSPILSGFANSCLAQRAAKLDSLSG